jgi:hypothetical protein
MDAVFVVLLFVWSLIASFVTLSTWVGGTISNKDIVKQCEAKGYYQFGQDRIECAVVKQPQ